MGRPVNEASLRIAAGESLGLLANRRGKTMLSLALMVCYLRERV